jgi:hypothetical protein
MNRKLLIDGTKPIELMTSKERDEYFTKRFGKTYEEFCKETDNMDMSDEAVHKRLSVIPIKKV